MKVFFKTTYKCSIMVVNSLIMLGGSLLIIFGSITMPKEHKVLTFSYVSTTAFAVGLGVVIFLVAIFGLIGTWRESMFMLISFAVILLIIFLFQFAFTVVTFIQVRNDKGELNNTIKETLEKHFKDSEDSKQIIVDIQQTYECCGIDGEAYWTEERRVKRPTSCCEKYICLHGSFEKGCVEAVVKVILQLFHTIAILAIVFNIIEVLGIALVGAFIRKNWSSSTDRNFQQ